MVAVLHDLNQACRYATNLIVMHAGKIVATGTPDDIVTADLVSDVFGLPCKVIPTRNRHPDDHPQDSHSANVTGPTFLMCSALRVSIVIETSIHNMTAGHGAGARYNSRRSAAPGPE